MGGKEGRKEDKTKERQSNNKGEVRIINNNSLVDKINDRDVNCAMNTMSASDKLTLV